MVDEVLVVGVEVVHEVAVTDEDLVSKEEILDEVIVEEKVLGDGFLIVDEVAVGISDVLVIVSDVLFSLFI